MLLVQSEMVPHSRGDVSPGLAGTAVLAHVGDGVNTDTKGNEDVACSTQR